MEYLKNGIYHILIQVLIITLLALSSGFARIPACGPACLHCQVVTQQSCCDEPAAEPCREGAEQQHYLKGDRCGTWNTCTSWGENVDYIIPGKVAFDPVENLLQPADISVPSQSSAAAAILLSARPPPQVSSPFYILNCSFLN